MPNITIKRKTGSSSYTELYPTTVISQVTGLQSALDAKINTSAKGASNGVAPLDSGARVPLANLPAFLTGAGKGFNLVGSLGATATLQDLKQTLVNLSSDGGYTSLYGSFWVSTGGTTLSWTDQTTFNPNAYHVVLPGDEGDTTSPITLEAGDMLVFTKYSITAGDGDDEEFTFSVINNSHQTATTDANGIVRLSSSTDISTTGNNVVTDGVLNGLVTSAGQDLANPIFGKIASSWHTHSQYQPLDATLTNFAGLTITNDTLPYGNGSDTFATTPFTSFGRTLVAETGVVPLRETLDVYSKDEVDTVVQISTANKANIYYDLSKTEADNFTTPTGSYIFDDLSTSNGW
jgi:hypothetical protein